MKRIKDRIQSKEDILRAAEEKFSEKGIYGTRVDDIAEAAKINKRMIYEYFGNKENLYKAVLSEVYGRLGYNETILSIEKLPPKEALGKVIYLYFNFLQDNPTYVNLILWENLNKGKYIVDLDLSDIKQPVLATMRNLIDKGKIDGIFKPNIDTESIVLLILTSTFANFSNRYTLTKLLGYNLDNYEGLEKKALDLTNMLLAYMSN